MTILIDNGHGIDTPGKRSPNGVFREYLFNRQVAELLCGMLVDNGYDARLLVTETNDVPLSTRVKRVNSVCSQMGRANVLLVSIHSNAAGNGSSWMRGRGWSCYTTHGTTESDRVAEYLYDAFEEEFPERRMRYDMSDGDRDWEEDFYILRKTSCPAVLLENFFYDNEEECRFLLLPDTKERIARATYFGIKHYLDNGKNR